jgi:methionyl-tRNA formyltransferase
MTKNKDFPKMRTVFMGTSDLSEIILEKLISEGYNLVGVFTKPDMKVGRKHEIAKAAVKILAEKNSIDVYQPEKFKIDGVEMLKQLQPDLVVVAAYGKILPKAALDIPKFGCINVHVSLLPKYRGPSPIQNALLQGETETGVTIMLMDEGVDTGDILAQKKITIGSKDNTASLTEKLARSGAEFLLETLALWAQGKIEPIKQDDSLATYCKIIEREDGHVFWKNDAQDIYNQFRAMFPWPGVFSYWKNGDDQVRIKLISISPLQSSIPMDKKEGEIFEIENEIGVKTGNGVIIIKEIQRDGKSPVTTKAFINGHPDFVGNILH